MVDVADLVDATDGAVGSAAFFGEELAAQVHFGVLSERDAGVSTLLGAVVHQT